MTQTIITYLQDNFIAILALIISLVSFYLNYINMKDRQRGEISQLISDMFTKILTIKNQLKSVVLTYELSLITLRTMEHSNHKTAFIDQIYQNKAEAQKSLENVETIIDELIKIQGSNNSSKVLSMLHALKLKILLLEENSNKYVVSGLEVLEGIKALQKAE